MYEDTVCMTVSANACGNATLGERGSALGSSCRPQHTEYSPVQYGLQCECRVLVAKCHVDGAQYGVRSTEMGGVSSRCREY